MTRWADSGDDDVTRPPRSPEIFFRALCRRWVHRFGRRAGGAGVGDPVRPGVARVYLDGSVPGEALYPYLKRERDVGFAFVAPALGVGFVPAWRFNDG